MGEIWTSCRVGRNTKLELKILSEIGIPDDMVWGLLYFYFTQCGEGQPSCPSIQCPLPGTEGWLDPSPTLVVFVLWIFDTVNSCFKSADISL